MDPRFFLMLVTRDPRLARDAIDAGIDRLFVDLEVEGKAERQRGRSTIISRHTIEDLIRVRTSAPDAEILARVNPPGQTLRAEVDAVIAAGADVVMLPFFTKPEEVSAFVEVVAGRARVSLLLETAAALVRLHTIVAIPGIDEIHVGLNDLHASLGLTFMYEILAGELLDRVAELIHAHRPPIRFGFGGGALLDTQHPIAPLDVLREHVRLGSQMIILSRSFVADPPPQIGEPGHIDLPQEVRKIRDAVADARRRSPAQMEADRLRIRQTIWETAERLRSAQ